MQFSKFAYLKSLHGMKLKAADYRVLVTLLDYARRDGMMAHPGTDRLASDCCMHRENVRQALRRLCDGGYIHQTHRGGYHRGASDYRFPDYPQQSNKTVLSNESQQSQNQQNRRTQQSHMTGTSVDEQIKTDDAGSSGNEKLDPWGAAPVATGVASKEVPVGEVVESDDCNPQVDCMQNVPLYIDTQSNECPYCWLGDGDHTYDCPTNAGLCPDCGCREDDPSDNHHEFCPRIP